jgi:hypothetical protein
VRYKRHAIATAYLIALLFPVIGLLSAPQVSAQSNTSGSPGGGIRVTPAIMQVQLQPNQNTLNLSYSVSNLTNEALVVTLGAKDFGAFSQNGSITLYGSDYNPAANAHGIQSYVAFPSPSITIPANTTQQVNVSIQNTSKLAPGGHYGAILFSPQSTLAAINNNHVNLDASIAGLVFLTTAYGGTYGVSASTSHISRVLFNLPKSVYLVFNDTGNTQTIPQGQATLLGPHSNIISTQVINTSSGLILSGVSRIFQVQLPAKNNWFTVPGIYHLKLLYKDNADTKFKTIDQTFLYINWRVAGLVLLELILAIYLVNKYLWKLLKRLVYFRVKRRNLKSIATLYPANPAPEPAGPKHMDVLRTKKRDKK